MKILKGTVLGGIAFFLLGWLIYGILLMDFMAANMNSCMNMPEGKMVWWAMILSNLISALLLTLVLKWSGARKILDGLKTGALFGLLYGATIDLGYWSMTTMFKNLGIMLADIGVTTVYWALVGLIIVLLWGKD